MYTRIKHDVRNASETISTQPVSKRVSTWFLFTSLSGLPVMSRRTNSNLLVTLVWVILRIHIWRVYSIDLDE